jgi:hypothetical protein
MPNPGKSMKKTRTALGSFAGLGSFMVLGSLLVGCESGPELTSDGQPQLTSKVRMVEGEPALFVNGEQKSMILAAPYRQEPRDFNTFRAGGIEIFNFYLRFPWTGPTEWDFSGVDEKLDEYISIDPDALYLPRILLTPGDGSGRFTPTRSLAATTAALPACSGTAPIPLSRRRPIGSCPKS